MDRTLQTSARNLDLMARLYEDLAEAAIHRGVQIEADAYNDAIPHLLNAVEALQRGVACMDGKCGAERPMVPVPAPVFVRFPMGIEHA